MVATARCLCAQEAPTEEEVFEYAEYLQFNPGSLF